MFLYVVYVSSNLCMFYLFSKGDIHVVSGKDIFFVCLLCYGQISAEDETVETSSLMMK